MPSTIQLLHISSPHLRSLTRILLLKLCPGDEYTYFNVITQNCVLHHSLSFESFGVRCLQATLQDYLPDAKDGGELQRFRYVALSTGQVLLTYVYQ